MLRKHRVLFVMDTAFPNNSLEMYKQLLSTKKNYIVYTCENTMDRVCLEILERDPDTVIFSSDYFRSAKEVIFFLMTAREKSNNLVFLNLYNNEDPVILEKLSDLPFLHNVNILSSVKYTLSIIDNLVSNSCSGIESFENDMTHYVMDLVNEFKCQRMRNGNIYVTEAIMYLLLNDRKYTTFNRCIYPYLMNKHNVSLESIDNAIRRFTNAAWENMSIEQKQHYFNDYLKDNSKPTAQEFIYEISDRLYIENRSEFISYYLNRRN